jgi:hypothetical protein
LPPPGPEEIFYRISLAESKAAEAALRASEARGAADAATGSLSSIALGISGKADLVGGKVPYSQLPEFPVGRKVNVPDKAARLALPAYADLTIAYQSDTGDAWGLDANADPATDANWSKLGNAQATGVTSFNGRTGNLAPQDGDYTAAMIAETLAKRYVSTDQIAAWDAKPGRSDITAAINQALASGDLPFESAQHAADTYLPKSAKGSAGGVAPLGSDGKVPASNLPAAPDTSGFLKTSDKGAVSGVAPLDAGQRVPIANLPAFVPQSKRIWREVKASRVVGTYYKNLSKNEQLVRVRHKATTATGRFTQIVVRASSVTQWFEFNTIKPSSLGSQEEVMAVVPADWEYSVTTQGGTTDISLIDLWYEMY